MRRWYWESPANAPSSSVCSKRLHFSSPPSLSTTFFVARVWSGLEWASSRRCSRGTTRLNQHQWVVPNPGQREGMPIRIVERKKTALRLLIRVPSFLHSNRSLKTRRSAPLARCIRKFEESASPLASRITNFNQSQARRESGFCTAIGQTTPKPVAVKIHVQESLGRRT